MAEIDSESARFPLLTEIRKTLETGNWASLSSSKSREVKYKLCMVGHIRSSS